MLAQRFGVNLANVLEVGVARGTKTGRGSSFLLALPGLFWLIVFFLVPLVFVLVSSFFTRGTGGAPVAPGHLGELHPHL